MVEAKTCVVIEDDAMFTQVLKHHIESIPHLKLIGSFGDCVKSAKNIETRKPDIVFLDVKLSGCDSAEMISQLSHKPELIVMSSGSAELVKEKYNLEIATFLRKPFTLREFKNAVSKCIINIYIPREIQEMLT